MVESIIQMAFIVITDWAVVAVVWVKLPVAGFRWLGLVGLAGLAGFLPVSFVSLCMIRWFGWFLFV
jgi:hypothetical protein